MLNEILSLKIKSDFQDYYDIASNDKASVVYERYRSRSMQRGTALKYLRTLGIQTIAIKPVSSFMFDDTDKLVVYTNSTAHDGHGKRVMYTNEAVKQYENCVASKFYENSTMTIKYLQIGKKRFTLYFSKENTENLDIGTLVKVDRHNDEYNRLIGLPIFSIDYIQAGDSMLATDFNEVENLNKIGISNIMDAYNVINEIKNALIAYNKI